jgi:hypothetical protein
MGFNWGLKGLKVCLEDFSTGLPNPSEFSSHAHLI